jgi:hypothetical protein
VVKPVALVASGRSGISCLLVALVGLGVLVYRVLNLVKVALVEVEQGLTVAAALKAGNPPLQTVR